MTVDSLFVHNAVLCLVRMLLSAFESELLTEWRSQVAVVIHSALPTRSCPSCFFNGLLSLIFVGHVHKFKMISVQWFLQWFVHRWKLIGPLIVVLDTFESTAWYWWQLMNSRNPEILARFIHSCMDPPGPTLHHDAITLKVQVYTYVTLSLSGMHPHSKQWRHNRAPNLGKNSQPAHNPLRKVLHSLTPVTGRHEPSIINLITLRSSMSTVSCVVLLRQWTRDPRDHS